MPGSRLPSASLARYIRCVDTSPDTASFIARWQNSGAAERANYQLFLSELCDLLGVARPDPTKPDDTDNAYVFERNVTFHHPDGSTSTGRIDLYKRGCYVLEAKQGVEKREAADWDAACGPPLPKKIEGRLGNRGLLLKSRESRKIHYARKSRTES